MTAVLTRTARTLEAAAPRVAAVVLALLAAASFVLDVRTPLWTDELLTLYVAQEPSISGVFAAIRDGADAQAPLYDLVVRGLGTIITGEGLRVRLPATLGFLSMCACVFVFVARRLPRTHALLATLIAARGGFAYASEGRAYGLVLGCLGVALLGWQSSPEDRRGAPLLGAALTAAIALHFHAVFAVLALALGELVRWRTSKRRDLRVGVALLLPPLVLAPHLPLILAGRRFLANYWSKPDGHTLPAYYLGTYELLSPTLKVAAVSAAVIAGIEWRRGRPRAGPRGGMPRQEWIAALSLAALPGLVILLSLGTIQAFVARYVQWSTIGVGVFVAFALHRVTRGSAVVAAVAALPLVVWSGQVALGAVLDTPVLRYAGTLPAELARIPPGASPVVVAGIHPFMEVWHYSDPALRGRLRKLVSPALEARYSHRDSGSLLLRSLGRRKPMGIEECEPFLASHPEFILAAGREDWLLQHLRHQNYRFSLIVPATGPSQLYRAERGRAGGPGP